MNSVATIQINRPILVNNLLEFRSNKQPKLSLFISLDTKCSSANYKPAAVSSFNQVISLHPNNSVEKKLRCWTILEKYRRCHLFVCMCCSLATKQLYAFRQDFTAETIAFRGGSRGRVQGVRTPPLIWSFLRRIYVLAFEIFLPHHQWRHSLEVHPLVRKNLDPPLAFVIYELRKSFK